MYDWIYHVETAEMRYVWLTEYVVSLPVHPKYLFMATDLNEGRKALGGKQTTPETGLHTVQGV